MKLKHQKLIIYPSGCIVVHNVMLFVISYYLADITLLIIFFRNEIIKLTCFTNIWDLISYLSNPLNTGDT